VRRARAASPTGPAGGGAARALAGFQLQVGGDPAGPEAAVLERADLQAPPAAGQVHGSAAAAG